MPLQKLISRECHQRTSNAKHLSRTIRAGLQGGEQGGIYRQKILAVQYDLRELRIFCETKNLAVSMFGKDFESDMLPTKREFEYPFQKFIAVFRTDCAQFCL